MALTVWCAILGCFSQRKERHSVQRVLPVPTPQNLELIVVTSVVLDRSSPSHRLPLVFPVLLDISQLVLGPLRVLSVYEEPSSQIKVVWAALCVQLERIRMYQEAQCVSHVLLGLS